ncbi:MAG: sigma-70 family RNA polymerase sigma factor [Candidatus Latescibacterota bacterium]|nr:MAG: sigma-70 family RNA polymerase sigma factor [Candidatus Latescibacterota bacterium]
MDLATLLQRCRGGDELAWEALVRQHQSRVYGVALHYVGNAEDARDVAQEIFVRIYKKLDSCSEASRFLPWMLRIARNACIDHIRRRRARPPRHDIPAQEMNDLASSAPGPEEQWREDSRKRLLHLAIQKLSELNREIILLKEIQGLSLEEIASMLDIPVGTVKSRSNRARLELARKVVALSGARYGAENAGS